MAEAAAAAATQTAATAAKSTTPAKPARPKVELSNPQKAAAGIIAPVLKPLGFGDWRMSTALITGFMAKESVVSTLNVLFGTTEMLFTVLTPLAAASLLVFCLLYTPCVAAIASIKREMGWKWAVGVILGQCAIAWIAAFIVRLIGLALGLG